MRALALPVVLAALPGPAAAQDFAPIMACAGAGGFDAPGCDPAAAAEAVRIDGAPLVRPLRAAGMESFAALYALNRLADGIDLRIAGGDCVLINESLAEADAVWAEYIASPAGMAADVPDGFALTGAFVDAAARWLSEEAC